MKFGLLVRVMESQDWREKMDEVSKDDYNFILNPCMMEESASPMAMFSTGFKDYIGGYGGTDEQGDVILEMPLLYQDMLQQSNPTLPPKVVIGMQPVYLSRGIIKFILIRPVTTCFLDKTSDADRNLVANYEQVINKFRAPSVIQPTGADVRKLTLAPE